VFGNLFHKGFGIYIKKGSFAVKIIKNHGKTTYSRSRKIPIIKKIRLELHFVWCGHPQISISEKINAPTSGGF
jgi:hypothetical protein